MTKKRCCLETLDYYYAKPNRNEEEQDDLEIQLAQALFSAGVPFAFVENLLVIQFFKCLRLSFKLPNRRKLAGDLLNDIYDEVKLQTDEQISKAKTLCMVSDGEEFHTEEWISNEIIQQMEAIGVQKFSAVITDTASDVLKIDEIKTIVENSKMIVNYFKSYVQSAAKLNVFKSLQKSKTALEQTLMDPDIRKKINNTVRNFVLSENFWNMLDTNHTIIKFLEPMVIALKLFESDTSTFSTVYFHFKKLMHQVSEISCNFSNNIQQLVQKWWNYTYHPVMMAAYMLDSCFLEKSKNTDIETMGYREFTEFTSKRFGQEESVIIFTELVKFRQKNSPYDNKTIWLSLTNLNLSVWWQSWPNSSLQQLAIKILSIPTSFAVAERNFSTFGFIHNKICN
ncbi:zinc finger BED domain-containing protein 1-like [Rhizophagus irregularis DAOM 181602=DAOM 197198]|nr:zinc finger BED domain-containing protein 1-like [Rhizophagus irregularis DAOM 181602=DAOM 197198]